MEVSKKVAEYLCSCNLTPWLESEVPLDFSLLSHVGKSVPDMSAWSSYKSLSPSQESPLFLGVDVKVR